MQVNFSFNVNPTSPLPPQNSAWKERKKNCDTKNPTPQWERLWSTSWVYKMEWYRLQSILTSNLGSCALFCVEDSGAMTASAIQGLGQSCRQCSWLFSAVWATHWTCKMSRWSSRDQRGGQLLARLSLSSAGRAGCRRICEKPCWSQQVPYIINKYPSIQLVSYRWWCNATLLEHNVVDYAGKTGNIYLGEQNATVCH